MPDFRLDNSGFTRAEGIWLQQRLEAHGFDPGPIDGFVGPPAWAPRTTAAIVAFKRSQGFIARPFVGPKTWAALHAERGLGAPQVPDRLPPWVREALRVKGWHERANNAELRDWLASDGHALGDPAVFPWCGDLVETAIRLSLSNEPFPGPLGRNPYWALNWRHFGEAITGAPPLGAVGSIRRNGGGHVFFVVGQDRSRFFALGGNQSNTVSVVPIDKSRCAEAGTFRWPVSYSGPRLALPTLTSSEASAIEFA
ncbi:peptidoglycan-binding protein [Wenxinia saemankumensis]|uniref:TIGR02594 family protein n=1 Tax=Wenxinia saemankumensis TaxID=1447782 RepID=A0A1M6F0U7_9RHOB|nr:peptidoglycan-binding protein [Wenxinia saemankumensis]SHI91303.1 TIGR02594 family protein [Wenxinia saemankumensis]